MQSRPLSLIAAATGGFLLASILWFWWQPIPTRAQFGGLPSVGGGSIPTLGGPQLPAQPIEVQALDPLHFVVATRETRLARLIGSNGPASNLLVIVVTYYTVQPNGLHSVEHVRVPPGYEVITVAAP
ncbi:MAG: hypothetical protein HY320_02025 [Armatimonadetes bacterium]|nr:hypothetical protein [Armatimonadota bacterium]